MSEVPDIIFFLGRFHQLVVHLPIGFLFLAVLLEIISIKPKFEKYRPVLSFVWLVGAISSMLAVGLGLFLSWSGGYDDVTLSWHKWSGIFLMFISTVRFFLGRKKIKSFHFLGEPFKKLTVALVAVLLLFTGHLGGSLTHGSDYLLEYAPNPIQKMIGGQSKKGRARPTVVSLDSADIFADAIFPILDSKCTSCHNKNKNKGKLLLTSFDDMMKGGEDGPVITSGSLVSSELYRRITLPPDHKEFMPSEGKKPLTEMQVSILAWWIENGAPRSGLISNLKPDKGMVKVLQKFYGLGKSAVETITAPPADTAMLNLIVRQGFTVHRLSSTSNLLEVSLPKANTMSVKIESLLGLKDQLVWLQLSNSGLSDKDLEAVGQLSNLIKLNLTKNSISDDGVRHLKHLSKLEYLNLNENDVSDNSVVLLMSFPHLKELYLWQTKVNAGYLENLNPLKPNLKIISKIAEK